MKKRESTRLTTQAGESAQPLETHCRRQLALLRPSPEPSQHRVTLTRVLGGEDG